MKTKIQLKVSNEIMSREGILICSSKILKNIIIKYYKIYNKKFFHLIYKIFKKYLSFSTSEL